MATIVTRAGKGSPLTNAEVDANFLNLNAELATKQGTLVSGTSIKTVNGQSVLGSGNIQIDGGVTSFNTRTGAVSLSSGDVTGALGFTPYNATNPSGYITSSGSISGNAATATALETARTINGVSFNGTANITISDGTKLPLAGGTMTGALTVGGNLGLSGNSGGVRVVGPLAGTNTTLVLEGSSASGSSANIELTNDNLIYFDATQSRFRSQDASVSFLNISAGATNVLTGALQQQGNQVLHAGNYTSYAPSLTGGGASGTWGINITGSAGSVAWTNVSGRPTAVSSFTNDSGYITSSGNAASATVLQTARTINGVSFNGSANITVTAAANGGNAATAGGFTPSASSGVGSRIVVADGNGYIFNNYFNSTDNSVASGVTAVMVKQGDNYYRSGTAAAIATFISGQSMNISGVAARATRANGDFFIDDNYGNTVVGAYISTRYQGVFAMGNAYKLPADGTTTGNLYGLAWSYPGGQGGASSNLASHGLLLLENGAFKGAWGGGSFRTPGDVRGTIFYDWDNTGYYVDPASVSYLYGLTLAGGSYFRPQNWIQFDSTYGLYWANHFGAHLHANDLSTYTQLAIRGSKNSYSGIYDQHSAVNIGMYDGGGNGGLYREANGRWYQYHNVSNNCTGFGTSSTNAAYGIWVTKGGYFDGRVDGTIFYDANNTGYYLDPTSTTSLRTVGDWRADSSAWTGEFAGKMQYHSSNWYLQFSSNMIFRNASGTNVMTCDSGGTVSFTGNIAANSDERLKKDWASMPADFVERLAVVKSGTYTRIDSNERQAGSSAQDWEKLLPEVVLEGADDDKTLSLAYGNAALVSAVELAKYVTALEQRISQLEARL
jgi:hypothetical protein